MRISEVKYIPSGHNFYISLFISSLLPVEPTLLTLPGQPYVYSGSCLVPFQTYFEERCEMHTYVFSLIYSQLGEGKLKIYRKLLKI